MMWLTGALLFVLALMVTIALHELGHLAAAKKFKLAVPEYFVGFGPTLFSRKKGDTIYGLKAIPLGGYVMIKDPDYEDDSDESMMLSHVAPWKRQIVYLAGPMVNIVIGTTMLLVYLLSTPFPSPTSIVEKTTCSENKVCVAEEAGLKAGDKIVALNNSPVGDQGIPVDLMNREMQGKSEVTVVVMRDGEEKVLTMKPIQKDGRYLIGVQMKTSPIHLSVPQVAKVVNYMYVENLKAIASIPAKVPVLINIIKGGERPDNAPVSIVGATKVSGDMVASTALSQNDKFASFGMLVASFNLGIGFLNLLPLLPLDGGRMLIAFIDSVRIRVSRLRKVEYKPTGPKFVTAFTVVVGILLFSYMGLVILADIVNPVVMK